MAKLVHQPRVKGQRDHFMLGLLQKASWRTATSDKLRSSHLKCKRHTIGSWNWKVDFGFRLSWVQSSCGVIEHLYVCVSVCLCECVGLYVCMCVHVRVWVCLSVYLSHLLDGLLTTWAAFLDKRSLYGSCFQKLQTWVVFMSHKERAPLSQLLCQSLLGPLQTFCPPTTVWHRMGCHGG